MENSWNPSSNPPQGEPRPDSSPDPRPIAQPSGWAVPSERTMNWLGEGETSRNPVTPQPVTGSTGSTGGSGSGGPPPPADFVFTETPPHKNRRGAGRRIAGGIAVIALMIGSGAVGGAIADDDETGGNRTLPTIASSAEQTPTQPLAKVAAATQPIVVSIEVQSRGQTLDTGSGFIWHTDGTIITNNHVISTAATTTNTSISVKFFDGKTAEARIVGRDPSTDIAVIKVDNAGELTQATLGTSSSLHVGDTVLALGSPLGLEGSVSSGIVSALHRTVSLGSEDQNDLFGRSQTRTVSTVADAIQTDAAINPGNSGGPLVDATGAVVGINTAIASLGGGSGSSGSIGVGFAIPIDEVQSVAQQLLEGKTPRHALLGVQVLDDEDGALIQSVTNDAAADKAGIREGDIITKVDGKTIEGADELTAAIRTKKPDDKVIVTYLRNGESRTADVVLGSSTG